MTIRSAFLSVVPHAFLLLLPRLPQIDAPAAVAHNGPQRRAAVPRLLLDDNELVTARRRLRKGKRPTADSILSVALVVYYTVFAVGLGIYISMSEVAQARL